MALNPSNSSILEQLALKGLTLICQKIKTSRDLDHAHLGAVCHHRAGGKTPFPAVGKHGGLTFVFGGLQLSSAGTVLTNISVVKLP